MIFFYSRPPLFQADRALLVNTLKENNIERPALPELPPEPEPVEPEPSPQDDKLERMMKTCSEYKQNLAVLQNQLATITKPSTSQESKKSKAKTKKKESQKTPACEMENGDTVESLAITNSDSAPMSQEDTNATSIIASALPIDQQETKD